MKPMNRFVIKTLGCKVNRSESDNLASAFRRKGLLELETDADKAAPGIPSDRVDVCVVNTCTVTEKASMQSRQAIRQAIRAYPHARIVVTGCYAQTQPEEILAIEGVSHVIPQQDKASVLTAVFSESRASECTGTLTPTSPWPDASAFSPEETRGSRTRTVLKVQDGCNAHCTYCIVPKARGKSRSMPTPRVISNLHALSRAGYQEVVLSGIHLGCYGLDFSPPSSLLALLENIDALGIMRRVRLSSIEPGELSDDIIDLVARSKAFCRHFHIPLQSGDDAVLRRMGRLYTRSFFGDIVQMVHARIPDAAIGVDVLVGFPGESDAAFENTFNLIDSLPVSYLHVFPFSRCAHQGPGRENAGPGGTEAAKFLRVPRGSNGGGACGRQGGSARGTLQGPHIQLRSGAHSKLHRRRKPLCNGRGGKSRKQGGFGRSYFIPRWALIFS